MIQPTMDEATMKLLKEHADRIQKRLDEAKKVIDKPVPMAGQMHKILKEGERPTAMIEFQSLAKDEICPVETLASIVKGRPDRVLQPGTYTRLLCKRVPEDPANSPWCVMMSDAPYEMRSSAEFIKKARGRVLVAGLGLGATLVQVLRKTSVTDVTVLEKNPDVIALVEPHIKKVRGGKKLKVIRADATRWSAKIEYGARKYDSIWLDIWPDISTSNLLEMQLMRKRYARYLRKGGWIGVWEWDYLHREQAEHDAEQKAIYGVVGGTPEELQNWPKSVGGMKL